MYGKQQQKKNAAAIQFHTTYKVRDDHRLQPRKYSQNRGVTFSAKVLAVGQQSSLYHNKVSKR